MTPTELLSLLSFEGDTLQSAEIVSETELHDNASFIIADLTCHQGNFQYTMRGPFVYYLGEDFIFTPRDWQEPWLESATPDDVEEIEWRIGGSNEEAIMLNGLPRAF